MDCFIYVTKTNPLISWGVTTMVICAFVFVNAKSRFSHDATHLVTCGIGYTLLPVDEIFSDFEYLCFCIA